VPGAVFRLDNIDSIHKYIILPRQIGRLLMLVLSRKESQRIRLGDQIVITIVKISGDKVRVGVEAPSNVLVLRDELEPRPAPDVPAPLRQTA
jgi:carbon storage regulator